MNKTGFDSFLEAIHWIVRNLLVGVIILFLSRLIFLLSYADWHDLRGLSGDVVRAFAVGLKFDLKVLTIALLPLIVIAFVRLMLGRRVGPFTVFFRHYSTLIMFLVVLFEVINFYFYKFYHTKINVVIFGFFEDDTWAVLVSIWKEYPVIPLLLLFALLIWAFHRLFAHLYKPVSYNFSEMVKPFWLRATVVIFLSGLYFLGMCGNLGVVPLDGRHATISENVFVNALPVNGLFSTKIAWADRKASRIDINIPKMLKSLKFSSIEDAASALYGTKIDSVTPGAFFTYTSQNDFLETNPPHVVFILMESMSNFYIDMHSDSCNMLGSLADVLDSCFLFRNFLPSYSGTIYSLESILVNTPKSPLSQSPYQNFSFDASAAKPFYDKGYQNVFITGGKMGWRNMDKFIPRQYFHTIEAEPTLRQHYPNGSSGEWGMHDEVLFQRTFELLSHSNGKPYLIFGMTISHHTPYDIPASYKGYPINIPQWARKRMKFDDEVVLKGLRAYQYANSCLGDFIKQIINSPLGENTIIVATGDHNIRQNFEYPQEDLFMQYSVPLLMYIPPKYRPKNPIDTKRFASHKDIFPTLYNLSLSNAQYPNFGNNLCDPNSASDFGLYCYSIAADSLGLVDFSTSPLFYRWSDREHRKLVPSNSSPDTHLDSLMIRARALTACMNYLLIKEIEKNR